MMIVATLQEKNLLPPLGANFSLISVAPIFEGVLGKIFR